VGGVAPLAGVDALVDCAEGCKLFERGVDAVTADMAVKEGTDLFSGQSVGGGVESLADTVGGGIAGAGAEEKGSARSAVVPYGKGSLEGGAGRW
jgi:hypothetical protein